MQPYNKMGIRFDVDGLKSWLEECNLWGEYPQRCTEGSPHDEIVDIWARFKDPSKCIETGDWSAFVDEHKSEWLKDIPFVKDICHKLMRYTNGERLGGVLITKLKPGGRVKPHIDKGWHAEYYDKYYLAIKNEAGARFCFNEGDIEPGEGDVYAFRNDKLHWVDNDSSEDRIAMIVCIKQSKFSKEGLPCRGE